MVMAVVVAVAAEVVVVMSSCIRKEIKWKNK